MSAAASTSDPRWVAAMFWQQIVAEVDALVAAGKSQNAACAELGVNAGTVSKKRRRLATEGVKGLLDQRTDKSGRKPSVVLSRQEKSQAQWHNLRKDSQRLALETCLNEGLFGDDTAAAVRRYLERSASNRKPVALPKTLRRQIAVTDEMRMHFRGKKHVESMEAYEQRSMNLWCPIRGIEIPAGPRDLYESDDESINQPFRFFDQATKTWMIGRQTLRTISTPSLRILGLSPVGRDADAYRDEDKLDHIFNVVERCGPPLKWRLEKGWKTNALIGIDLERELKEPSLAGQRWGALPFELEFVPRSRAKAAVEGSFNHTQRLSAHEFGVEIGRYRSEFERSQKLMRQAQDGQEKALVQFPELAVSADFQAAVCAKWNSEPHLRGCYDNQMLVPDEMWFATPKRQLPMDEVWRFLPVKDVAVVQAGAIRHKVKHYPQAFRFRINGRGAYRDGAGFIPHGYRVLIAYHPARPEAGCYVACAELGRLNREGHRLGEMLCIAPLWHNVPQAVLGSGDLPDRFLGQAQAANAAVRREFREIVTIGNSGRSISTVQSRDGLRLDRTLSLPSDEADVAGLAGGSLLVASRTVAGPVQQDTAAGPATPASSDPPGRIDLDALRAAEEAALDAL